MTLSLTAATIPVQDYRYQRLNQGFILHIKLTYIGYSPRTSVECLQQK